MSSALLDAAEVASFFELSARFSAAFVKEDLSCIRDVVMDRRSV